MKKIISVFLCIALLSGPVITNSFAESDSLKITVTTDTHYQCAEDTEKIEPANAETAAKEGMLNNDIYFHASFQGQMNHESEAILRSMLHDFENSDSEYLLICGDLTCGKRQSHLKFAEILKETEKRSGKQIYVICGNHDCDDDNFDKYISIDEFKEIYKDFGYNEALSLHNETASYTVDLSDNYRLIAIDTAIYGSDNGKIDSATVEWIKSEAEKAKKDGKNLIAMMHHSILNHFSVQPMIDNSEKTATALADSGIKTVFTGHIHANDISMAETKSGNQIYDIQTGALITSPNAYREVTFTDSSVNIESKYVTEIDTEYLPDGFTPKQLNLMETNFSEYAYGYFEAGLCRWFNKYIGSAGKVGKLLKLTPGSKEYELVDFVMSNIGEALNLPIYDNGSSPDKIDSIEEIAQLAGMEIPKSDYEKLYQVAAKIMSGFYHGDEPESTKETEFPLFYACVKAVLARSVANLAFCTTPSKIADSVLKIITGNNPYGYVLNETSDFFMAQGITDYILESTLLTVTNGFTTDFSQPDDINIIISGYGINDSAEKTVPLNIFEKIMAFIKNFLTVFIPKLLNIQL